jgi:hypothetical protein
MSCNALSDYLESGLLKHIFLGSSFNKPSNITVALTSGEILDHHTGETIPELASGDGNTLSGYARISLGDPSSVGDSTWIYDQADHDQGSGLIKNSGAIVFEAALTDWGYVSGIAIVDHADYGSGNLLMHSTLDNPRIVYKGDSVKFDVTNLQVKFN